MTDVFLSDGAAAPAISGLSLTQYRRRFGQRFSCMRLITTGIQTSPPSGGYAGIASGPNASRRIVSTMLADSDGDPNFFDLAYVYVPDLPYEVRVKRGGWGASNDGAAIPANTISTSGATIAAGYLETARPWGQVLPAGLDAEIWARLPVLQQDFRAGVHACINLALGAQYRTVRYPITGLANVYRYALPAAASWVTRQNQLLGVYDYEAFADLDPPLLPGGWGLRFDGQTAYVTSNVQPQVGHTFYVALRQPLNTLIRVGDTWGTSTVGLVNETDQATGPLEETVGLARYFALDTLIQLAQSDAQVKALMVERDRLASIYRRYLEWEQAEEVDVAGSGWGDSAGYLARRGGGGGIGSHAGAGSGRSWP